MSDDAPRLTIEIGNHVFTADIENAARRQHVAPMCRHGLVAPIIAPELGEVVGVMLSLGEQLGEARDAGETNQVELFAMPILR
jgi:hypothetical protein